MSAERPVVALLTPCWWPEVIRGSERMIRELADELIARGYMPRLVTSHPGRPSRAVEDGMEVVRHWRPPESALDRRLFQGYLTHVPLSYATLRAGRHDLAHAFYATDAVAANRWARVTGRPAVFSYTGLPHRAVLTGRRLRLRIVVEAVRGADAVVAQSRSAAEAMWRWLGVEPRVIHPGIDTSVFTPGGERDERPTIFCAAAIDDARKRIPLLVAAFERVRRERPDARLVLVGRPGTEPADGIELVEPGTDRAALVAAYRGAWVTALPSYREAFGMVLVESLACGTPVVGARSGAIPEIVDRPGIGALFEASDVDAGGEDALARALLEALELSSDPATPAACRLRAEDFSTARFGAAHQQLYAELGVRSAGSGSGAGSPAEPSGFSALAGIPPITQPEG